jgi:hypothetical protein
MLSLRNYCVYWLNIHFLLFRGFLKALKNSLGTRFTTALALRSLQALWSSRFTRLDFPLLVQPAFFTADAYMNLLPGSVQNFCLQLAGTKQIKSLFCALVATSPALSRHATPDNQANENHLDLSVFVSVTCPAPAASVPRFGTWASPLSLFLSLLYPLKRALSIDKLHGLLNYYIYKMLKAT